MTKLELLKLANDLTSASRDKIKNKNFALPGRKYPIENKEHAADALARVSQFGTPEEKAEVRKKVYEKYPELAEHKIERAGTSEEKNILLKAAALGFLEKIKLAQRAVKHITNKSKLASIIVNDFFQLPADVKLASLLDKRYSSLLKEAFDALSYGGTSTYGGQNVGVWNAIEKPKHISTEGLHIPKFKPSVTVAGAGVRNDVEHAAGTAVGKFVKKLTRFAGKVVE